MGASPAPAPAAPPARLADDDADGDNDADEASGDEGSAALAVRGAAVPEPEAARAPGTAGAVLIADDNAVNALLASSALKAAGFRVDTAGTGAEALERMSENAYAVVFMDIRMPVMDGLEATRRIRSLAGPASQTPIVALTADIDPDLEDSARRAGISQLAAKPIDPPRLRELAAYWANRHDKAAE